MDITKLRYFTTAAECGNFSEAARLVYTSQPNISKQIASLEAELDTKLFVRNKGSVRLTRAGEYLYEQTKDLPSRFDRIFETTRAFGRSDQGELAIGIVAGQRLGKHIIGRFHRFTERYPALNFTLERAGFSELNASLSSLRFDMIITFSFDVTPSPELHIESIRSNQQPAIFVSRISPLSQLEDFSQAPFVVISPKESYGGYDQFLRACRSKGFEPNIVRIADSLDSLLFYVEAGIGVAILDRNTPLETDQNIRIIPFECTDTPDIVAVWSEKNSNPNLPLMLDCLKETI